MHKTCEVRRRFRPPPLPTRALAHARALSLARARASKCSLFRLDRGRRLWRSCSFRDRLLISVALSHRRLLLLKQRRRRRVACHDNKRPTSKRASKPKKRSLEHAHKLESAPIDDISDAAGRSSREARRREQIVIGVCSLKMRRRRLFATLIEATTSAPIEEAECNPFTNSTFGDACRRGCWR